MGLERAKSQGKRLGRPSSGIKPKVVLKLREEGHSIRAIAERLGVSKSTISG